MKDALERLFLHVAARPWLSRAAGALSDARLPRPLLRVLVRAYVRAYAVDVSEALAPVTSHETFNGFFTRRLRPEARPIASAPDVVVSPADARLQSAGRVPDDGRLEQIKGMSYSIEALLGGPEDGARYRGGIHATLYLSPAMYHRVHAPVDGRIVAWRYIPGRTFPVNGLAVRHVDQLFAVNERVALFLESDRFGPLALVMVGAANVARIGLSFCDLVTNRGQPGGLVRPPAPIPIARGAELGVFNLGSTVVLLAAEPELAPATEAVPGGLVRMGQALWRRGVR